MNREYKPEELFNLIKSRMFFDRTFAYYKKDGSTYKVRINIEKE